MDLPYVWNVLPSCVDIVESWKIVGTNSWVESLAVPVFSPCNSVASMILSI